MKVISKIMVLALVCISFSCNRNRIVSSIEKEDLFTLDYGSFEDQVNLFNFFRAGDINTSLYMRDGFFYIVNGESKKVMEMNSYGDLITLYYNEAHNPSPSFATGEQSASSTREAKIHPFNEISSIAVDSEKKLYIVDRLSPERQEIDQKTKQTLSQIILCFDEKKNFIHYIGQQGPGGTPFPFIKKIYTTEKNELVVLCNTSMGAVVYWYSADGFLLYTIPVENSNIPNPFSEEYPLSYFYLDNIVPDLKDRVLYLKADYYTSYVDESSHVQSGIEYLTTLVHPFDVEKNSFDFPTTIPPYSDQVAEGFSKENYEIPYDFLGVTESGWFFFMVSTDEGFSIQMVQSDGQRILKRRIGLNREENLYYTFNLSREGIISALLVQKDRVQIAWWRIDSLIQAVIKN